MKPSLTGGRQRLRPAERTEAILTAATEAFAAAVYDQVSVAAVGRACGASEALVFKYFETKAGLYAAVMKAELDRLDDRQKSAVAALPANSSARDLVRVLIETTLDHLASATTASLLFSAQVNLPAINQLRGDYRRRLTDQLLGRLRNPDWQRGRIGVVGFLGFLSAAAQQWVTAGCPPEQRRPLVDAVLGALQGAIGDWDILTPPGP